MEEEFCCRRVCLPAKQAESFDVPCESSISERNRNERSSSHYSNIIISYQPDLTLLATPSPTPQHLQVQMYLPRSRRGSRGGDQGKHTTPNQSKSVSPPCILSTRYTHVSYNQALVLGCYILTPVLSYYLVYSWELSLVVAIVSQRLDVGSQGTPLALCIYETLYS